MDLVTRSSCHSLIGWEFNYDCFPKKDEICGHDFLFAGHRDRRGSSTDFIAVIRQQHQSDRVIFLRSLPQLDGKNLRVTMVEVNYGPGESSKVHSHPCPVIGYVLEGSLRMKVTGESEAIYKTGDTFYEAPNGVHEVSANASHTMPAKFVAYFVCDREMPLSVTPISNQGKSQ